MQVLLNGIGNGLTIALLAMSFALVHVCARVFPVALGGIYAVVPFVAWQAMESGWPWYAALTAGLLSGTMLSLATEIVNHGPLGRRSASGSVQLVASLGTGVLLLSVAAMVWGNETQSLRRGADDVYHAFGMIITRTQAVGIAASAVIFIAFYLWLRLSNLGLRFRALASNPVALALRGYNVSRLRLLVFGVSGLLCSLSALIGAYDVGFDIHSGLSAVLLAAVATIVGGRTSFLGPFLGGLLMGILRSEVVWYLSASWQDASTFSLLALFLLFRPQGIVGRETRLEARE